MFWRPGLYSPPSVPEEMRYLFRPAKEPVTTIRSEVFKWYITQYPEDDLAFEKLNDLVTFEDIRKAIYEGNDVYQQLGVRDSVIRERVFGKLAALLGVEYDRIYDRWVNGFEKGEQKWLEAEAKIEDKAEQHSF